MGCYVVVFEMVFVNVVCCVIEVIDILIIGIGVGWGCDG